jgi:signal transduction histidine kinase/CheY-like chemotaxis protein
MSLPVRYYLAAIFVAVNVVGTVVVATFAYQTSRQTLEQQALVAAGDLAESRREAVLRALAARQQRLEASLASLEALCGERSPRGRLSLERECLHAVIVGVHSAERAGAVEVRNRGRRIAARGSWRTPMESPAPGVLAAFTASDGRLEYTMRAERKPLVLRARFPAADLAPIFQDRSGLSANGETVLFSRAGAPLTPLRDTVVPDRLRAMPPLQRFLAGETGVMHSRDYRDVAIVSAYRPAAALGAGCVLANIPYADILVSIDRLGRTFVYWSAGFVTLGILLSIVLSRAIATPIARLAASARAMQQGRFNQPVRAGGPAELRELAHAFSTMGRSIGDLVHREQAARREAEKASRLKDAFLATVSHELRTPLSAIVGWSTIIARGRVDPSGVAHGLDVIQRNARRQARLIDDLLDLSRLTSGQMRLRLSTISLDALVDEALDTVRPAAEAKQLQLVKNVHTPVRPVRADPDRLHQVIWNLLSNAVRFTPDQGRIEVDVREVDGQAEIRVTDTGMGLSEGFIAYAFEPFQQADSSTTRSHGGLGLGLAIVRHLVELHGGTVRAESAGEGRGASFTVRLPIAANVPAVATHHSAAVRRAPAMLHGMRVLVVDDDPDTREVLRALLEDAGAIVSATASAGETRAMIARMRPDLLIADIGMPTEDGYSLMRSVRALESDVRRRLPAIALTAHAHPEDVDRALASGFQVHLAKPVDPSELVTTIASLVAPPS